MNLQETPLNRSSPVKFINKTLESQKKAQDRVVEKSLNE